MLGPRVPLLLVLAACFGSTSAAQGVLRVDATGAGGAFVTIQEALDVAVDGDAILVATGSYPGFTLDDKSVVVAADTGAAVEVTEPSAVVNLAPGRTASLLGLELTGSPGCGGVLLRVADCAGPVFLQDLNLEGPGGIFGVGFDSVYVEDSASVSLVRCRIGTSPGFLNTCCVFGGVGPYRALVATDSAVFLYDCELAGGDGCDASCGSFGGTMIGTEGSPGLALSGGAALVVGSRIEGGAGGAAFFGPATGQGFCNGVIVPGGDDAPAVRLEAGLAAPVARFVGSTLSSGTLVPDVEVLAGTTETLPGAVRSTATTHVIPDQSTATVEVRGEPFDVFWLGLSYDPEPSLRYFPGLSGTVSPRVPWVELDHAGVLDGNGEATLTFFIEDWGFPHVPVYHQTYLWDGVDFHASNPELSLILDDV